MKTKRVFILAIFIMTAGVMNIAADAGEPDDELVRQIREAILAIVKPRADKAPRSSVCSGPVAFPGLKDEAKKERGATAVIRVINEALSSMEGQVTLFDYDKFVWPTLRANGVEKKYQGLDRETSSKIMNELEANWLILGSVENGKFKVRFEAEDGDQEVEIEFDPGATFLAELMDWVPGPRPRPEGWTAPGKIEGLAFMAGGKQLAVGSNSDTPEIIVLEPKTRTELRSIKVPAKVNDLFYDGTKLLAALRDRVDVYDEGLALKLSIPINDDEPLSVVSGAGKILVTGRCGGVFVYDSEGKPIPLPQKFHTQGKETLAAASIDGTTFGISSGSTAWIFPATTLRTKSTISGDETFNGISFNKDDALCLGTENGVLVYDVKNPSNPSRMGTKRVNTTDFSPNGILMFAGGEKLRVYKYNTDSLIYTLLDAAPSGEEIATLACSHDYVAAAHGRTLNLFSSKEPSATLTVKNSSSFITRISFNNDMPLEIQPGQSIAHSVVIPDSQETVSLWMDDSDPVILSSKKFTLKAGSKAEASIRDDTTAKAILVSENRLEITALAATKDSVVAAYPTIVRGKTSVASAEVVLVKLKEASPVFLRPHLGEVVVIRSNPKYIATIGLDKKAHVYNANGNYRFSATLGGLPIGAEIDGSRLLVILEDGVSILPLDGNGPLSLAKAESASWNGAEITATSWKASQPEKEDLSVKLDNGSVVTATDHLSFVDGSGKEVAAFGLYSTLEWALTTARGSFTGSGMAAKHIRVSEGPKVEREFKASDGALNDYIRVKSVMATYIK